MLEDEEAVDYGEEELSIPASTVAKDEVSLMLDDDDATPNTAESTAPATPEVAPTSTENVDDAAQLSTAEAAAEEAASTTTTAQATAEDAADKWDAPEGKKALADVKDGGDRRLPSAEEKTNPDKRERKGDRQKDNLAPGWRAIQSRSGEGEVYYYNEKTGESSWSKPIARNGSNNHGRDGQSGQRDAGTEGGRKKKKKNRKPKWERDAAKAAAAAAAAAPKGEQSAGREGERAKGEETRGSGASKDAAKVERGLSIKGSSTFSIRGSAQRNSESARDQRPIDGRDGDAGGKRKRENNVSSTQQARGEQSKAAGETRSNENNQVKANGNGSGDAKRQRTERDRDTTGRDRVAKRPIDDTPRDRRTGDSWRPSGGDSGRWSADRRDRERERERERDTASSDRRRDPERRDDRPRDRDRDRDARRPTDAKANEARRSDSDRKRNGAKDAHAPPSQPREAGSKASTINSTHSTNKRQWGANATSAPAT